MEEMIRNIVEEGILINCPEDDCFNCKYYSVGDCIANRIIDCFTKHDVIIPVRCEKCEYCRRLEDSNILICGYPAVASTHDARIHVVRKDHYCSFGKRKEGDV